MSISLIQGYTISSEEAMEMSQQLYNDNYTSGFEVAKIFNRKTDSMLQMFYVVDNDSFILGFPVTKMDCESNHDDVKYVYNDMLKSNKFFDLELGVILLPGNRVYTKQEKPMLFLYKW